jgi:hypothetical protein
LGAGEGDYFTLDACGRMLLKSITEWAGRIWYEYMWLKIMNHNTLL